MQRAFEKHRERRRRSSVAPAREHVPARTHEGRVRRSATASLIPARGSHAIRASFLDRRARHVAIRAENAAIALERAQHLSAMAAVVEELACISRHGLDRDAAARRTGEGRDELGHAPPSSLMSGASKKGGHSADKATKTAATESIANVARGGATAQLESLRQARRLRI